MLPYSPQLCNVFSASPTPAWQGSRADERRRRGSRLWLAIAWRALGRTGPARSWWSLRKSRTPVTRELPAVPPPTAARPRPVTAAAPPEEAARLASLAAARPSTPAPAPPAAAPLGDALRTQAHALVTAFYQRFHGLALAHATELLATHGEVKAHFLLPFAHEAAGATDYQPQTLGGILHYLPRALAAYEARATQATTQPAAATDRTQREQYAQWRQQALAQLRATQPPAELAALEATQPARLVAAGTPAFALGLAVRVAVDEALEAQAGLPAFAAWREGQATPRTARAEDAGAVVPADGGACHAS